MNQDKDHVGTILTSVLLILIIVVGIISYKSIDWTVLNRIEQQELILPTPITSAPTATPSSPSSKTK